MKNIDFPQMIQIGSTGRNSGKTMLAKKLFNNIAMCLLFMDLK